MNIDSRQKAPGTSRKLKLVPFALLTMRLALCSGGALLFAICVPVRAQQPGKVPRIGYLTLTSLASNAARIEAFRQGLRELGYVEGKNIAIEWRSGEGKVERQDQLAVELVSLKIDMIVASGPQATRAAKQATGTTPIVMAFDTDPVGNGFVASLARPGANITGLSALSPELGGKQLELLKEIIPKLSRVAVLGNSNEPANPKTLKEIELAASAFELQLQALDVLQPRDIETAFRSASKERADALVVLPSPLLTDHRTKIANFALNGRFPAIYYDQRFVEAGGLMSYATSFTELSHRAATYVDKILKGAKPAELPVEQPTKFELVVNLNAAKQIRLTIPASVLARADRVIR
jgi:putative tryptophan/tyrosine transport system substrate-binding protein